MDNFILMGYGEEAEILLAAFAVGSAIQQTKEKDEEITMEPVACLRCDLETQKQFLANLLAEEAET
ncbi:MAG: hypothetical protein QHJ82_04775 [Verrucomicrobiota bacterium]|nr:hypothetical protein [Verrucomicrobiota bacterium]